MQLLRPLMAAVLASIAMAACSSRPAAPEPAGPPPAAGDEYIIGPGDTVQVFVWQHPELSASLPVRPDGKVSTPLVEDMQAAGKKPSTLARDLEVALGAYVRSPTVNVMVSGFRGTFSNQIRVVGQAAAPQAIPYRQEMTLLDVMIQVGGLAKSAAGNRGKIIRQQDGKQIEIPVRIDDLINGGDISANLVMHPGDVLIIPESRF